MIGHYVLNSGLQSKAVLRDHGGIVPFGVSGKGGELICVVQCGTPLGQPTEKQRREDNGLCRYCGADDHWAKDCPKKSKFTPKPFSKPTQSIAAVQTSPDVVFELGKDNA